MAGTINFALTQQFDMDGEPLSGGLLFFFAASTTTPQTAFQDIALTIPHPNPVVLDASGRVPMFYLADGNIKIRLANKAGVTVIAADNLLVIGPSSGGGGGAGVDPTTVMATGDMKARFGVGPLGGFVRCNGETVGNAVSGSTERANADCQALFEYLWSTTVLGVFAGTTPNRGATANADWLANKRIATPDLRGRAIAGMDDMGATAANRLTSTYFGAAGTTLGNAGGAESSLLDSTMLPAHLHGTGTLATAVEAGHTHGSGALVTGTESAFHQHQLPPLNVSSRGDFAIGGATVGVTNAVFGALSGAGAFSDFENATHNHVITGTTASGSAHSHTVTGSTANAGGGLAHKSASPAMVVTIYIKL